MYVRLGGDHRVYRGFAASFDRVIRNAERRVATLNKSRIDVYKSINYTHLHTHTHTHTTITLKRIFVINARIRKFARINLRFS